MLIMFVPTKLKKGFALTSKAFKGFTLIELLVVISIIAILAGFGTARYLTAEKQTRDTQRKSDLAQYRLALENYASAHNSMYPEAYGDINNLCALIGEDYLSNSCLNDPLAEKGGYRDYLYYSNRIDYVLAADLEKSETTDFVICSNGLSGEGVPPTSVNCTVADSSDSAPTTVPTSVPTPYGITCYCCDLGRCRTVFVPGASTCTAPLDFSSKICSFCSTAPSFDSCGPY